MAVATDAIRLHFGALAKQIHGPAHILNVLPRHALSVDEMTEKDVPFVVAALEPAGRVPAFLEAHRVRAQDHVAFADQRHAGVVLGRTREAGGFAFSKVVLVGVLMPHGDGGRRISRVDAVRYQQERGHGLVGLHLVGQRFDPVAVFLKCLPMLPIERARGRPGSAEAGEQFCAEGIGIHRMRGDVNSRKTPACC